MHYGNVGQPILAAAAFRGGSGLGHRLLSSAKTPPERRLQPGVAAPHRTVPFSGKMGKGFGLPPSRRSACELLFPAPPDLSALICAIVCCSKDTPSSGWTICSPVQWRTFLILNLGPRSGSSNTT